MKYIAMLFSSSEIRKHLINITYNETKRLKNIMPIETNV